MRALWRTSFRDSSAGVVWASFLRLFPEQMPAVREPFAVSELVLRRLQGRRLTLYAEKAFSYGNACSGFQVELSPGLALP